MTGLQGKSKGTPEAAKPREKRERATPTDNQPLLSHEATNEALNQTQKDPYMDLTKHQPKQEKQREDNNLNRSNRVSHHRQQQNHPPQTTPNKRRPLQIDRKIITMPKLNLKG